MAWPLSTTLDYADAVKSLGTLWREFYEHFYNGASHTLQKGVAAVAFPSAQIETERFRLWEKQAGTIAKPEKLVILIGLELGDTVHRLGKSGDVTSGAIRQVRQEFSAMIIARCRPDFDYAGSGGNTLNKGRLLVAKAASWNAVIINNFRWALGLKGVSNVEASGPGDEIESEQFVARIVTASGVVDWTMTDTVATP